MRQRKRLCDSIRIPKPISILPVLISKFIHGEKALAVCDVFLQNSAGLHISLSPFRVTDRLSRTTACYQPPFWLLSERKEVLRMCKMLLSWCESSHSLHKGWNPGTIKINESTPINFNRVGISPKSVISLEWCPHINNMERVSFPGFGIPAWLYSIYILRLPPSLQHLRAFH